MALPFKKEIREGEKQNQKSKSKSKSTKIGSK